MKKKLTLLMVALVAVAAFAVQQTRRAASTVEFDFDANALELFGFTAASTGSTHDGDFTETKSCEKDGVTIAVSPSGGNTPNRVWGSSPALRMYGGTMTITAPTGKNVTKIAIEQGKWNDNNNADSGELTSSEWTGSANAVVLTIAANTQFKKITVTLNDEGDVVEDKYVIAGSSTALFGETWAGKAEANQMAKNSEGIYEKVYTDVSLPAGDIEYKIVKNGTTWIPDPGDNKKLNIPEAAAYKVVFTFNAETQDIAAEATKTGEAVVEDVYIGVGVAELFGTAWDANNDDNKLIKGDDGKYSLTKEGLLLAIGEYGYKITKNGAWIPDGTGNEQKLAITENGIYTMTLTVDPADDSYLATAQKTGDAFATIAELTALENNAKFAFFGEPLVVAKVAKPGNNGTAQYVFIKDETGASLIYDASGEKTAAAEAGKTIAAPWTGKVSIYKNLFELVPDAALTAKDGDAVEVTYDEATAADVIAENVNKVVIIKGLTISEINEKNITFAIGEATIAGYNQFGIELPEVTEGKTFDVVGAIGRYNDNIQFQPITITEAAAPVAELDYYLAGTMTEWKANEDYKLALNEAAEGVVEYMITVDLPADAQFKVAKSDGETIAEDAWYPAGMENNYIIKNAGNYTIYFRPNGDGGEDWHYSCIYAKENIPAQTATFNFADPNFRENIGEAMTDTKGYIYNETFTADGVSLQITGGSAPSRIYVDNNRGQNLVTYKEYTTLTFKAPEGKAITKIEFTAAGNSNINNFTATSGGIEGMIWTGNAAGVRFAQGGTSYLANAILTLVDKNDETAALPAIEYTECENIAAFNALEAGTYAKLTLTNAEVIGKSADGYSTVWVQDATGGAWIQYTSLNDRLQEGTKVSGTVYTIKRLTAGNPQLKEAEATINSEIASEAIAAYTIVEGSIDEVNVAANLNKVVKISGATLEMTSATAGKLTIGETTINVNNGTETATKHSIRLPTGRRIRFWRT